MVGYAPTASMGKKYIKLGKKLGEQHQLVNVEGRTDGTYDNMKPIALGNGVGALPHLQSRTAH